MKIPVIKFSHRYVKMPKDMTSTMLLAVFVANASEFSELFVKYDTFFIFNGPLKGGGNFYTLPNGKVLVLLLISKDHLWTTIRRWTPWKEKYYRSIIGQEVKIEIKEGI